MNNLTFTSNVKDIMINKNAKIHIIIVDFCIFYIDILWPTDIVKKYIIWYYFNGKIYKEEYNNE